MSLKRVLGVAFVVLGLVLVLLFPGVQLWWFQGGWLGMAFIALGVLDLLDDVRTRRIHRTPTMLEELRRDVLGPKSSDDDGRSS